MALTARFSLPHSDLNDFLFATVGEEQNGMPLNVVSGLTRLGLDPWGEAARLAVLPKGSGGRKARADDRSAALRTTAVIRQFGHQLAIG